MAKVTHSESGHSRACGQEKDPSAQLWQADCINNPDLFTSPCTPASGGVLTWSLAV